MERPKITMFLRISNTELQHVILKIIAKQSIVVYPIITHFPMSAVMETNSAQTVKAVKRFVYYLHSGSVDHLFLMDVLQLSSLATWLSVITWIVY